MSTLSNELLPIILTIILGIFLEKNNILGNGSYRVLNIFAYYIGMPALLFSAIVDFPFDLNEYKLYSVAIVLSMMLPFILLFFYYYWSDKNLAAGSLKSLAAVFPNGGFIGIPVLSALFGQEGVTIASISTILTLLPFLITVILLEYQSVAEGFFSAIKKSMKTIIKNPLLLTALLAFIFSYYQIKLPIFFSNTLHLIGKSAIPCALISVGQMLVIFKIEKIYSLSLPILVKLCLHPLLAYFILSYFDLKHSLVVMGVIVMALPTAVMQSVLAYQYQKYEAESSGIILLTTVFSFLTIPLVIYLF